MTTGERIKARRLELEMTTEDLGDKVGLSKSTIGRYESANIKKIPYKNLVSIAIALGTTVRELAGEETEPTGESGELISSIDILDEARSRLIKQLTSLDQAQVDKVDAFVQGLIAAQKD